MELYKDRYQFTMIKSKQLPIMLYKLIDVLFLVIIGVSILMIGHGVIAPIYYTGLSVLIIVQIFIMVYNTNKSIMVSTYIDDFATKIKEELNKREIENLKPTLKKIESIIDESIVKEEYYVAQNLSEKTGDVFRDFLKNSIGKEQTETIFKCVVSLNINQLRLCENSKPDSLRQKIIAQQYQNLQFCLDNYQTEWFKRYLKKYGQYVFQTQKDYEGDNQGHVEDLYIVYKFLAIQLVDENNVELLKYMIDDIRVITSSLVFMNKNTNLQNYTNLLTYVINYCNKKNKTDFEFLNKEFVSYSRFIFELKNAFDDVKVYYALLFNEMKQLDIKKAIKFYEDIFDNTSPAICNSSFIEFKQYCIKEFLQNIPKEDACNRAKVFKFHVNSLIEIIDAEIRYNGLFFLPDFEEEILQNQYNQSKITEIINEVKKVINHSILKDNISSLFQLLSSINKIFEKTTKQDKEIQIALFDVYAWLLNKTKTVTNKQFFEISYDMLEQAIALLDKNRAISDDFGKYIIKNLANSALQSGAESIKIPIIEILFSFLQEGKEKNFVVTAIEKKDLLYRSIFNIGVNCIENNYEEGLRSASNAIGWLTIYTIKQMTNNLTHYLIERAIELYKISKKMEVSEKTLTFSLTLFTTVGMYCCKKPAYRGFLYKIYSGLKGVEIEKLKVAVDIRTSENDTWNDLFDKKTDELRAVFLREYKNVNSL